MYLHNNMYFIMACPGTKRYTEGEEVCIYSGDWNMGDGSGRDREGVREGVREGSIPGTMP